MIFIVFFEKVLYYKFLNGIMLLTYNGNFLKTGKVNHELFIDHANENAQIQARVSSR